jgi:hypothetical protein
VDKTRVWTGLYVVVGGDVAIAVAALVALLKFADTTANASSAVLASICQVLPPRLAPRPRLTLEYELVQARLRGPSSIIQI